VPLDVFFARGEDVTLEQARLIEEVFGARIVRTYSSQETGKLAHACPECGRYHVNSEMVILEVVDERGQPVAPGETGQVLVTPLLNLAMPLVRYRIGDLAIPGPANSCSRTLPALERIAGRIVHLFRTPDGRAFMPSLSDSGLLNLGAGMWQLAQTGTGRAELRLVAQPGRQLGRREAFAQLAAAALPDFNIEIRQLESLPPTASGKHIPYVCELDPD
jgi:phenylacetate-CoA ligase